MFILSSTIPIENSIIKPVRKETKNNLLSKIVEVSDIGKIEISTKDKITPKNIIVPPPVKISLL
tara:strand:+ start:282 stop:473 length:192 start_codon:yes stop_codon:yes gene_type:complete